MALQGVKVIEMMGLAPGPFCGTILADFGAEVTVIQKIQSSPFDVMSSGKRMISVDLKSKAGIDIVKKMASLSDVLIDTYRPGVMEKLGLGPIELTKDNDSLIYARLTGYGQDGYYKNMGGHDMNYVAISGILSMLARQDSPPQPPINLLADFAGGSVMCALGIVMALFERSKSGKGQIIDASMTEGAAYLGTWLFKSRNLPIWSGEPGTNVLDGGVAFYRTYKTKDSKYMAVGALEPQFYNQLLVGLGITDECDQMGDQKELKQRFQQIFLTKTQDEWINIFDRLDACVTPVLDLTNVHQHKSNSSRNSFTKDSENMIVPLTAPRLSRTPGVNVASQALPQPGDHTIQILKELGYSEEQIVELVNLGTVFANHKSHL